MGWCEGSEFAERFIRVCKKYVKDENERRALYEEYISFLCNQDWDTEYEVQGIDRIWDEAMQRRIEDDLECFLEDFQLIDPKTLNYEE
jgi:hypothetical protein